MTGALILAALAAGADEARADQPCGTGPGCDDTRVYEVAEPPTPGALTFVGCTSTTGAGSVGHLSTAGPVVRVPVSCKGTAGARCVLKLTLTVTETLKGHNLIAVAARAQRTKTKCKVVVVGAATVTLPAVAKKTLRPKLGAGGRGLFARYRRLAATVTVAQATSGSKTVVVARRRVRFTRHRRHAQH